MVLRRVDILQPLFQRLKRSSEGEIRRGLIYGLPEWQSGSPGVTVAISLLRYVDTETTKLALRSLPYGMHIIGLVEFNRDEEQDLYEAVEQLESPVVFKIVDGKVSASTGLDYLTNLHINIVSSEVFWEKTVTTFHVQGKFLLYSMLETPDLKDSFAQGKARVLNQSSYVLGNKGVVTLLPRHGQILSDKESLKGELRVGDLVKGLGEERVEAYFRPGISLINVTLLFDQTKSNSNKKATLLISDTSARCKFFEHYLSLDYLVMVPNGVPAHRLYKKLNMGFLNQLEFGFHDNILDQLTNSISAEKPEPFHFWPPFASHFVTAIYPEQTSEEKLKEFRHELHELFFVREVRPYFRRSAALFQPMTSLISPHLSLKRKGGILVNGHYEYKHYMQDDFNDDGWGCAYRSLQTIVSWFRLQGFTARPIPSHKEIQECLVSLGDKPASFVGSKQWIGSTEVSFVLEALLGVSSRIISMSNGAEMSSSEKLGSLQHHFKTNGTPVMVGGGVYAHTIIGVSEEESEEPAFLILDPHWTGADELKTIEKKGWVGWKDKKFWSTTDFYNLCLPLLPSSI